MISYWWLIALLQITLISIIGLYVVLGRSSRLKNKNSNLKLLVQETTAAFEKLANETATKIAALENQGSIQKLDPQAQVQPVIEMLAAAIQQDLTDGSPTLNITPATQDFTGLAQATEDEIIPLLRIAMLRSELHIHLTQANSLGVYKSIIEAIAPFIITNNELAETTAEDMSHVKEPSTLNQTTLETQLNIEPHDALAMEVMATDTMVPTPESKDNQHIKLKEALEAEDIALQSDQTTNEQKHPADKIMPLSQFDIDNDLEDLATESPHIEEFDETQKIKSPEDFDPADLKQAPIQDSPDFDNMFDDLLDTMDDVIESKEDHSATNKTNPSA